MAWTKEQKEAQAERARLSWLNPETRRKRLENRSKNKKWQASRSRCASIAAQALHENHKVIYLAGQRRSSITMRKMYKDSEFKERHRICTQIGCQNPDRNKAISEARKEAIANGTAVKFWEFRKNIVSKLETNIFDKLEAVGVSVKRQYKVPGTRFVADGFIRQGKIIIEVDGHIFHYQRRGKRHDRKRDKILTKLGYAVVRLRRRDIRKGLGHWVEKIEAAK